MEKVYICDYGFSHDWIMGKIADDIQVALRAMGVPCRCGGIKEYAGEEICYHLAYHMAKPFPQAKHNSVFYTHLNDCLQERVLLSINGLFDSYICMSPEDAAFLNELGFDKSKVYGKILPVRNTYVKPINIGIFSACYPDGRKNEKWLVDFCRSNIDTRNVNFVFIGSGWGRVVSDLSEMECSFEWHFASRKLPYEYQFQQNKLANLDYYIYMGMDGGAMGTYDAYAQCVPMCVTYDGYHKALPRIDFPFDNFDTFSNKLNEIVMSHKERLQFFQVNNRDNYSKWLYSIWTWGKSADVTNADETCISYRSVLEKKRNQYYKINLPRLIKFLSFRFKHRGK